ncbi:uncharacterized protein LOC124157529 [Ischnura elegans]|uniref:uncharacterized protein LOC124157529 n=1 Tax=Ischnura elegans TaxID=197161 RepID=UPI001ED8702F|nr:uncharacterized protein LOC124157529 [Ischnura elegans]
MGASARHGAGGTTPAPSLAALLAILCAASSARAWPQWRPLDGRVNSPVAIRRLNGGDAFRDAGGLHGSCAEDFCRSAGGSPEVSSSDPGLRGFWGRCTCRCPKDAPSFREDIHKCTDDIDECSLADFESSIGDDNLASVSRKLPLVLLPLRGQVLHPNAFIKIDGITTNGGELYHNNPKCSIAGAHFLTRHGWVQLSNSTTDILDNLGSDLGINQRDQDGYLLYREFRTPFGIYEDGENIQLKWMGELNTRELLGGRMVLVHLSCLTYDMDDPLLQCVGFRVAGTISMTQGIREMTFDGQETTGPDLIAGSNSKNNAASDSNGESSSLTSSEWIAIAAASLFLGAIYVTSVFLYLNLKKTRKNNCSEDKEKNSYLNKHIGCMGGRIWRKGSSSVSNDDGTNSAPDGIVKTNPLLILHQCRQHQKRQSSFYIQGGGKGGCRDEENKPGSEDSNDDEPMHKSTVSSSPMMHKVGPNMEGLSSDEETTNNSSQRDFHHSSQGWLRVTSALVHSSAPSLSPIERLPEENVSIVEPPSTSNALASQELAINVRTEPPDSLPPDITSDDPFVPSLFSSSPEALLAAMMGMNGAAMGDSFGQSRRKLYFNPAFFEPELLQAPPPAALEFLSKIREVIALARHRMAAKKFSPSLLGIPEDEEEEDAHCISENVASNITKAQDNTSIAILPNLKRENSRHSCKPGDKAIQQWLNSLNSTSKVNTDSLPIKVGPEIGRSPPPPIRKKQRAPPVPSLAEGKTVPSDTMKAMNAVIRELEVRRGVSAACRWDGKNENGVYEVDSLEKTNKSRVGTSTEVVATKNKASEAKLVDETSSVKLYRLPELLSRVDGYSLVSEVYVNDTYDTVGSTNRGTVDRNSKQSDEINVVPGDYDQRSVSTQKDTKNGCIGIRDSIGQGEKIAEETVEEMEVKEVLTITLEDSPSNHRRNLLQEEETFEMDTLDRKKTSTDDSAEDDSAASISAFSDECNYMDSLERPLRRISLRSSGSFRSDTLDRVCNTKSVSNSGSATDLASVLAASPLTRAYGSLREVYEARQHRRREQRRRRTSDIASKNGFVQGRHHNLSALPAWRLARRPPEDDTTYYDFKPQCYSPISHQSNTSPLHLVLMPPVKKGNEQSQQKPSSPPSLMKNKLEMIQNKHGQMMQKQPSPPSPMKNQFKLMSQPSIQAKELSNHMHYPTSTQAQQPFSNTHSISGIEATSNLGYFKQEGLYTSPYCDEDDDEDMDEDADTAEDDEECNTPLDSLDKDISFPTVNEGIPFQGENLSMLSFWHHLQNQSRLIHQNGSTGSRKGRKLQKTLASEGVRLALELQRELNKAQQRNSRAGSPKKQGGVSVGKVGDSESGKANKRTWRRLIEKREKEREAEEESRREVRVRGMDKLEGELRKAMNNGGKPIQRKDLKFRVEDSGYLSSSDESALGRVSLRRRGSCALIEMEVDNEVESKKGDGDMASDSEGESVFDGASESGAESIATDSFFGSFRVFSTAAQKAEQLQSQRQRCSALFEMISEGNLNGLERVKARATSEEDATDSESGAFPRVNGNPKRHSFATANS